MFVNQDYADILRYNGIEKADDLWNIKSESVKSKLKERGTSRAFLKLPGTAENLEIYIKRYTALPVKEYFKSAFSFKPIFISGAMHEWEATLSLIETGILTAEPIAAAKSSKGTCIVLRGIQNYIRASELLARFANEKNFKSKRHLIAQIAEIAGKMHSANFAHQDFYLLHFFVQWEDKKIYIIDLQRVIMQKKLSLRWRVKDLAQLNFSSKGLVRRTDKLRFWKRYCEICGLNPKDISLIKTIFKKSAGYEKKKHH
ncbi:MAG: lipopolysaccharide kinase InaA family protein [Candidatus Nanoarchaeia archaeon]